MRLLILAFALGVCLCQQLAQLWPAAQVLWMACIPATLSLLAHRRSLRIAAMALGMLAALGLGLGYASLRAEWRLAEALPVALEGQDVQVIGYVADLPDRGLRSQRFQFVATTRPAGVPERLLLSWYDGSGAARMAPTMRGGEQWSLSVRLRRPHGNLNPHGFDYEGWLFERDIRAVGYVRPKGDSRRVADLAEGVGPVVQRARQVIRERFERVLPQGEWSGVLSALAVGDQSAVPPSQWRLFSETGITHLMSISGGHVTLFAALVAWLVRLAWARFPALCLRLPAQKAAVASGVLAAFIYVLLSGFGVPAQRTLYMLLAVAAGLWSGRQTGPWRGLMLGLLVVLLIDPWAPLSAGFWLSFGAVAALSWAGMAALRSEQGVRGWLLAQLRAQWAILLLSLPLLLGIFQQFSLISPLANAVAIPVVSAVVTPLALLFALIPLPSLAELAHAILSVLMQFIQWLGALPVATWQQAAPPIWLVCAAALGGFWALLPRGIPGRWPALLLIPPMLAWTPLRPASGEYAATVIDVGQGLAVHVQTAQHDLLFDAGPQYSLESDSGERVIHPYLRAQGVQRLQRLVVSHADTDHSGGAASLMTRMTVDELMSSLDTSHPLVMQARQHVPCAKGQVWEWDGVRFEVLHPDASIQGLKENDRSCVLKVSGRNGRLLLTGDIELKAENALLESDAEVLRSDDLVAPHHGSRTSSQQAFIDAVGARRVIFTTGYRNRFGHPHPAVVERYVASGASLYRSDRDGAVRLQAGTVDTERARNRRYWHGY
ncbi:MAG: DNA internalization-related competence protein ComEC/Rec2 [Rhodocyclaceae bacterium]